MLSLRLSGIATALSAAYVIGLAVILTFPDREWVVLSAISAFVFIPAAVIGIFFGTRIEIVVGLISAVFVSFIPFGLPGTLLGWGASLLLGLMVGRVCARDAVYGRVNALLFSFAIVPLFAFGIIYRFLSGGISYELESSYFQNASINFASSLLIGSGTLMALVSIVKDRFSHREVTRWYGNVLWGMATCLMFVAVAFAVALDYRTGVFAMLGMAVLILSSVPVFLRYAIYAFTVYVMVLHIDTFTNFLVPGREEVSEVLNELAGDGNRLERAVSFFAQVFLDKSQFRTWSEGFSVSALSDLVAVAFPISIVLVAYIGLSTFNCLRFIAQLRGVSRRAAFLSLYISGLLVTMLQPDFFNLFVLGFQMAFVNSLVLRQLTSGRVPMVRC